MLLSRRKTFSPLECWVIYCTSSACCTVVFSCEGKPRFTLVHPLLCFVGYPLDDGLCRANSGEQSNVNNNNRPEDRCTHGKERTAVFRAFWIAVFPPFWRDHAVGRRITGVVNFLLYSAYDLRIVLRSCNMARVVAPIALFALSSKS